MRYWKEHMGLRAVLMLIFFILGFILLIAGWKMRGLLSGLGIEILGVLLLLTCLMLYNKPFEDEKDKKKL